MEIAASAASMARRSPLDFSGAHHRLAHAGHDRAHIGEIEIDEAFLDHQVGDARDAGLSTLSAMAKASAKVVFSLATRNRVLVRDDQQRVDVLL